VPRSGRWLATGYRRCGMLSGQWWKPTQRSTQRKTTSHRVTAV